jgi:hypothetical protein
MASIEAGRIYQVLVLVCFSANCEQMTLDTKELRLIEITLPSEFWRCIISCSNRLNNMTMTDSGTDRQLEMGQERWKPGCFILYAILNLKTI